jgi:hypothetical protein
VRKAFVLSVAGTLLAVAGVTLAGSVFASGSSPTRSTTTRPGASAATPSPRVAPRPKKVLVVGDSVAVTLGVAIQRWGERNGITVQNSAVLGCTLMDGNLVKNYAGTVRRKPDSCHTRKDWRTILPAFKPDVVVALFGGQDVYDMSWDNGKSWTWAGKAAFDKRYLATMSNASTRLSATGARVLWLTPPCFAYIKGDTGSSPTSPWYDKRRVTALRNVIHTVAANTHQSVTDVIHAANCPVDFKTRPDGVHFSRSGGNAMMPKLGPVIRRALAG